MNNKLISLIATMLIVAHGLAIAGPVTRPAIVLGSVDTPRGGTAVVTGDFLGDPAVTNFNFRVSYEDTVFDESAFVPGTNVTCTPPTGMLALTCIVDTAANTISGIGVSSFPPVTLVDGLGFITITLPVLSDAPFGISPLTVLASPNTKFVDTAGDEVGPNNSVSGSVNIVGPRYAADLAAGGTLSMGAATGQPASADLVIGNIGALGTTLTGDGVGCVETADPSGKFTLSGDVLFSVGNAPDIDTVNVACDSSAIGSFSGEMQCTHDGDNTGSDSSPVTYNLGCEITAGPLPRYTGTPVNMNMTPSPLEQGDAALTGSLTIDNTLGDGPIPGFPNGSILTGDGTGCTYSGNGQITVLNQGDFSLPQVGGPTKVLTWSCNTAAEGSYSGTLSCNHNGVNVGSPVDYFLECDVGPPGDAGYASVPGPGGTVDMTPTGDSLVDSLPVPTGILTITNTPPGLTPANDRDLLLDCGLLPGGDGEITATPASNQLAPGASSIVNFSCDNDTAGQFSATYECDYDEDGDNGPAPDEGNGSGTASYTVTCGVRDPESDVDPSPTPGELLTILVPQGGTNTVSVFLIETIGEGAANASYECSLGDDTFFTIISNSSGQIGSGETVEIVVEGRDPRPDEISASTTLDCEFSDSQGGADPSWPIEIRVPAEDIPTMSDWSRVLLILSLLAVGGFVVRRRMTA